MMVSNINYGQIYALAKSQGASHADFSRPSPNDHSKHQDKVTLSDEAKALMSGSSVNQTEATYAKPTQTSVETLSNNATNKAEKSDFLAKVQQQLLDQKLGVDREKLKEIEAMMEKIAQDENLSPDEKKRMLESLTQMREEIFKQGNDNQRKASTEKAVKSELAD